MKIQQALQESSQREAQAFRAAQALQDFSAAQAKADMQRLMGPVAALKEQLAAAQVHIVPLIEHWKENQERAQRLVASFQPRIDSRWTEALERLQTLGAPLKGAAERVRGAFQLFQPSQQQEVLQVQKKLQEFTASFQAVSQDWKARLQPLLDWMTSEAFQEEEQRISDITPTVSLGVTCAVVYTYGCDDGRIAPTRCAIIAAGLDGR